MKRCVLVALLVLLGPIVPVGTASAATSAAGCRAGLKAVSVAPSVVTGGKGATATVTLTCKATRVTKVRLAGFKGVSLPGSVSVARGKASAKLSVRTAVTRDTRRGVITASLGRTRRTARLTVRPTPHCAPKATALTLPALVHAGDKVAGTLRVSCAPSSPLRVGLKAADARLSVPAQVTVAAGKTSVAFSFVPQGDFGGRYASRVTAGGTQAVSGTITVDPGLKKVVFPPSSDMNSADPEIMFTGPAPKGGLTVRLTSDNPAVEVPPTAFFQEGAYGGGVGRVRVRTVAKETTVHVSATLGGRTLVATKVLVPPFDEKTGTLTFRAQSADEAHGLEYSRSYDAFINRPAPAGGVTVNVKVTEGADVVELDRSSDTITEGQTSTWFRLNTADVTRTRYVTIVASIGTVTTSLRFAVQPRVTGFAGIPASVKGGESFTGTVTLAGPADHDLKIDVESAQGGVEAVPQLVTIPAGAASATFTVTTIKVSEPFDTFLTAYLGDQSVSSDRFTVAP